jgi:ABC-type oligopeptide transport system substrate-binding subunit
MLLLLALLGASSGRTGSGGRPRGPHPHRRPETLDPPRQGDSGSAAVTAQLFESLTAFDADRRSARPRRVVALRRRSPACHVPPAPGLTFSDGSPLRPSDVARSWLRLIDPDHPSPLASIAFDIAGAEAYLRGQSSDPLRWRPRRRLRQRPDGRSRPSGGRLRQHHRRAELQRRPPGVGKDAAALQPGGRSSRAAATS